MRADLFGIIYWLWSYLLGIWDAIASKQFRDSQIIKRHWKMKDTKQKNDNMYQTFWYQVHVHDDISNIVNMYKDRENT